MQHGKRRGYLASRTLARWIRPPTAKLMHGTRNTRLRSHQRKNHPSIPRKYGPQGANRYKPAAPSPTTDNRTPSSPDPSHTDTLQLFRRRQAPRWCPEEGNSGVTILIPRPTPSEIRSQSARSPTHTHNVGLMRQQSSTARASRVSSRLRQPHLSLAVGSRCGDGVGEDDDDGIGCGRYGSLVGPRRWKGSEGVQ